ncbi:hypothetical protein SAMN05421852_11546, partial [Thermoflavimicrobium dichotomicum]
SVPGAADGGPFHAVQFAASGGAPAIFAG